MVYKVMKDFAEWCEENNLVVIHEDGTVAWREKGPNKKGKLIPYKDARSSVVRDIRADLSADYKDYASSFGTVWPFKVLPAPGQGKPVADVAK